MLSVVVIPNSTIVNEKAFGHLLQNTFWVLEKGFPSYIIEKKSVCCGCITTTIHNVKVKIYQLVISLDIDSMTATVMLTVAHSYTSFHTTPIYGT